MCVFTFRLEKWRLLLKRKQKDICALILILPSFTKQSISWLSSMCFLSTMSTMVSKSRLSTAARASVSTAGPLLPTVFTWLRRQWGGPFRAWWIKKKPIVSAEQIGWEDQVKQIQPYTSSKILHRLNESDY